MAGRIVFQHRDFRGNTGTSGREKNLNHPKTVVANDKISSFVVVSKGGSSTGANFQIA
jgi:hypothetical protein